MVGIGRAWERPTKLTAAAAAARLGLSFPVFGATLGKADAAAAPGTAMPLTDLLTPAPPCSALTVECLFGAVAVLIGESTGISRVLAAVPFFKAVVGGSGRGRELDGVVMELKRLTGELFDVAR